MQDTILRNEQRHALRLVAQIYRLRMLGLGLGFLSVGAALDTLHAPLWQWVLLVLHGLAWPHAAFLLARGSRTPRAAEYRNIAVDAALGGAWIAWMHFNLVPSLLVVAMMTMDMVSAGGWRLLARGLLVHALACLAVAATTGFAFQPATSQLVAVASAPLLLVYPVAVSAATYVLAQRVNRQNRMLDELSRIDGLTGLPNRQHWQQAVATEFLRFQRSHRPAALAMLDVDGFKRLNDEHGHTFGDVVLRRIGAILRESGRGIDVPGRFGGDEFAMVMPETSVEGATRLLERVRQRIECEGGSDEEGIRLTVSIGIAQVHAGMSDPLDWIEAADAALYQAKAAGRNRVIAVPAP